jgi:glucans biosynthesis protein C
MATASAVRAPRATGRLAGPAPEGPQTLNRQAARPQRRRWPYLDELKVLVIAGVIVVHVAITYGAEGSWYVADLDESTSAVGEAVLSVFVVTGALFSLGLLFLVAGALTVPSLERKGARRFMLDRLERLGLPLIAFIAFATPLLEYVSYRSGGGHDALAAFLTDHTSEWVFDPGPLWFIEALLIFSFVYVAWVTLRPRSSPPTTRSLTGWVVVALVAVVAAAEFSTRLAFPLGSEQLRLQLALFPQYVFLFAFGVAAWRRGWLDDIGSRIYRRCRAGALVAAAALPPLAVAGGGLDDGSPVLGGLNWESLGFALADSTLACCASLWLLEAFRRHRGRREPGELGRWLSRRAYGAYIVQPMVIVPLALAASPVPAPGELKFLLIAPLAVAASFGLGALPRTERPRLH